MFLFMLFPRTVVLTINTLVCFLPGCYTNAVLPLHIGCFSTSVLIVLVTATITLRTLNSTIDLSLALTKNVPPAISAI